MRSIGGALVASALVLFAVPMSAGPAGAAPDASCKTVSGTAKFSPALPKSGASHRVSSAFSASGKVSGCTGSSPSGGTVTIKNPKTPLNCKTWLTYDANAKPLSGTETIKWSGGQTSTVKLSLLQVKGKPTQRRLYGTVTSGALKGYRQDGTVNFTLPKQACKTTTLSAMTYRQVTATTFQGITPPP
jgi:hypothetical protein